MKRLFIFWVILLPALTQHVHAQYYSVNYDARTVAAMAAAFGTEAVAESYYREQVDDILKHYTAAEVAAAGIFSSKFLEHKALSDLGIWCSSTENYYYRRIYHMVAEKIMPKIWVVAKLMLRSPQTAIHWGQLPDEGVRRYEEPVYAVRKCGDKQHAVVFGHRFSGN